jgi:[CysO sulfur-carrier protein]-S-L-cysteine hydrolase
VTPEALRALSARLVEVAEADPGREVCGFLVRHGDGSREVVPLPNRVGEGPLDGQSASPRHAFLVDAAGHLELARRLRRSGGSIEAVFHSHVDGPARLSPTDVRLALWDGEPVLPGVWQVVVGMRSGKASEIRAFSWKAGAFAEVADPPVIGGGAGGPVP